MPSPTGLFARITTTTLIIVSLVGCGSGSPAPTGTPGPGATSTPVSGTPTNPPAGTPVVTPGGGLTPGSIQFRFIHVFAPEDGASAAVDVAIRTQGVVQAHLVTGGVGLGTVTDYFAPPEPGSVVLAKAGAADLTCVITCADFYYEASTTSGQGDQRTLLLYGYDDPFATGTTLADLTEVLDLWEHPDAASIGSFSNAIAPADPASSLVFVIGAAVLDARFGLHLAIAGTGECLAPANGSTSMIGGNQIIAFDIAPGSDVTLHDTSDPNCSGESVGGPFAVESMMGGRSYLILYGGFGSMEALTVLIP